MKHTVIAFFIITALASCVNEPGTEQPTSEVVELMKETTQNIIHSKSGMLIHLSSGPENPHKVLMALKMSKIMSTQKEVLIYLDINGVKTVFNDSPDISFKQFTSSHAILKELIESKVKIVACPSCIEAAEKTANDLIDGVDIATSDIFFTFCDGKVITLDY